MNTLGESNNAMKGMNKHQNKCTWQNINERTWRTKLEKAMRTELNTTH